MHETSLVDKYLCLIFVVHLPHRNISTTNISQIVVHTALPMLKTLSSTSPEFINRDGMHLKVWMRIGTHKKGTHLTYKNKWLQQIPHSSKFLWFKYLCEISENYMKLIFVIAIS